MRIVCLVLLVACSKSKSPDDASVDVVMSDTTSDTRFDSAFDSGPIECDERLAPRVAVLDGDVLANLVAGTLGVEVSYPPVTRDLPALGDPPTSLLLEMAITSAVEVVDATSVSAADVRGVVEQLFRRELRGLESSSLEGALSSGPEAVDSVLMQALLAPDFLLLRELAPEGRLSPSEVAMRMSRAMWRDGPTPELVAAVAGGPGDAIDVLMADPRAARGAHEMHRRWLRYGDFVPLPQMAEETDRYVASIFAEAATYDALIASPYTFVDDELAMLYGLPERPGSELTRVSVAPERASLFVHGSMTAGQGIAARGVRIAERVLCRAVPPPPPSIDITITGEGDTQRERYESTLADPSCLSCHAAFDPYGFAFESYGRDGAYREMEDGFPIDASFEAMDVSGNGVADLMAWLVTAPTAWECYARQWVRYVADAEPAQCMVDQLGHVPGTTIPSMLARIAQSEPIMSRPTERGHVDFAFRTPESDPVLDALQAGQARAEGWAALATPEERVVYETLRDLYVEQIRRRSI